MKTTINISEYDLGDRQLVQQISDDPETGFARIIVFDRFEVMDDIKQLSIVGRMHYVNQITKVLLPKFTHITLSKGVEWIVDNSYKNVEIGMDGNPVPNPNYNVNLPTTEENFLYKKKDAYDNFSKIMFTLLTPLVVNSVLQDDIKGYFNVKDVQGNNW